VPPSAKRARLSLSGVPRPSASGSGAFTFLARLPGAVLQLLLLPCSDAVVTTLLATACGLACSQLRDIKGLRSMLAVV